jgi:hypothetical protein
VGLIQPSVRWETEALSLVVKQSGHEADHLPSCSAELRMGGAVRPCVHDMVLS